MYNVTYNDKARNDILLHEKSGNKPLMRKLLEMLAELEIHPKTGIGKPEQLKHNRSGQWSRRINDEHRLVYTIEENIVNIVNVLSAKGHY